MQLVDRRAADGEAHVSDLSIRQSHRRTDSLDHAVLDARKSILIFRPSLRTPE